MTRLLGISFIASALALGACGGDDNPSDDTGDDVGDDVADDTGDDTTEPDAADGCTAITVAVPQTYIQGGAGSSILFQSPITEDLGDGGASVLQMEFYHLNLKTGGLIGAFDLSTPPDNNYISCDNCFRVFSGDAEGNLARQFFQRSGSVTHDQDPVDDSVLAGLTTEIILEEVTIAPDFTSTPVPGGACLTLAAITLEASSIPAEYTCDDATWTDGATCDCVCGVGDPDCEAILPVEGCTGTEACTPDSTCVASATNDTCAQFIDLTVGTTVSASNYGVDNDYDAGLNEGCTLFDQPGRDVAFRVNLTAGQSVTITVTPTTEWDPAVAILNQGGPAACDAATLSCAAGADVGVGGDAETLTFTATTAGNHMIIVDSFSPASYGAFDIVVENTP